MNKKKYVLNVNECGEFTSLGMIYVFSTEKLEDVPEITKLAYDKYKSLCRTSPQMIPSICICIDGWDYEIVSGGHISDTDFYPDDITKTEQFVSLKEALTELIRKDAEKWKD